MLALATEGIYTPILPQTPTFSAACEVVPYKETTFRGVCKLLIPKENYFEADFGPSLRDGGSFVQR
jgi:hypothetical protein